LNSVNSLFRKKAVDKISIHTFLAKEKVKVFQFENGKWNCGLPLAEFIQISRNKQMNDLALLSESIQRGEYTLRNISDDLRPAAASAMDKLKEAYLSFR
jgi:hypothetical protein